MKVRQRLWWVLGGVFLLFCVGFVVATYRFGWSSTGFLSKSLWDWLQLLIIPLVLAIIAVVFQRVNSRTEQQIALDKQREDLLQAYLDRMTELLLKENLLQSAPNSKERNVARVRTITVVVQLDVKRIEYVFAFLRESGLMSNKPSSSIVSLSQADLSKINLSQVYLSEPNLSGAYLNGADFSRADLSDGANLNGADLSGANLSRARLWFADLIQTRLERANLSGADLTRANLSGANLSGADLRRADLSEANLSGAFLERANLSGADLSKANLDGADLVVADLSKANLSGANLSGANLSGAKVTEEQLKKAKSLENATMLDGSKHP